MGAEKVNEILGGGMGNKTLTATGSKSKMEQMRCIAACYMPLLQDGPAVLLFPSAPSPRPKLCSRVTQAQ